MDQRPKRKYDYLQQETTTSPAAMSLANIGGPRRNPIYYNDNYEPIDPSPELQELYNKWRQLEEQEELRVHLLEQAQLASPSSDGGQNDAFLRPPSLSATSMSRSPSCASTSASVTGAINNMGLGEEKPTRTRRKQGRQGPLGDVRKARTALLRKLHACQSCHSRKVACLHHNFGLLEDTYQASKQLVRTPHRRYRQNNTENTRAQQQDLLGVGVRPNLRIPNHLPSVKPGSGHVDAYLDFQNLLSHADPISPNTTAPLYNFADPSRWPNMGYNNTNNIAATASLSPSYPYPASFSPSVSPISAPPMAPRTAVTDPTTDRHMPIGRRIAPDHGQGQGQGYLNGGYAGLYGTGGTGQRRWEWECRFGDDGTLSSCSYSNMSDSNDAPIICKQRYGTLENLQTHFQNDHVPFENGKIYPFCTRCSQHYDYAFFVSCPTCGGGDSGLEPTGLASPSFLPYPAGNRNNTEESQEQWYWGDILPAPDHGSGQRRTGTVLSGDGGFAGGGNFGSLARSGTITQLDVWNKTFFGGGGFGGGGGGGAAAQGRSGRGNFSCSMPQAPDFSGSPSSTGDADKHGNLGYNYSVNLFLSPSHPSSLFKPPTSKMLAPFIAPLSANAFPPPDKHTSLTLSSLAPRNPNAPKRTPTTRGRARSCPYYAYSKEIFGGAQTKSLTREASNARGGLSISLSSGLPWPTTCSNILIDSSTTCHSTASNLTSTVIRLLLLVLTMLSLTHGLSLSQHSGQASRDRQKKVLSPPWFGSHPRATTTTAGNQIFEGSVICVLLGLADMWLIQSHLSFRRVLLATEKDDSRSVSPRPTVCSLSYSMGHVWLNFSSLAPPDIPARTRARRPFA
ncbi:hypothetical protein V8F06_011461 [Rhypophila decipiens]